jgi:hypothetical protein
MIPFKFTCLIFAVAFSSLWSCEAKLTVDTVQGRGAQKCGKTTSEKICDPATLLQWKTTSPTSSSTVVASWTKSVSSKLDNQLIRFYSDAECKTVVLDAIDLQSKSQESYSFTATKAGTYYFMISSVGIKQDSIDSSCSDALVYASTTSDNVKPTLTTISSQSTLINTPVNGITFNVSDNTTLTCTTPTLSIESSDTTIVSSSGVVFGGTYPNCTMSITPQSGASGTATITLIARDNAGNSGRTSFSFEVISTYVIGQPSLTRVRSLELGVSSPYNMIVVGSKLIVGDSNNERVLIWNTFPTAGNQPPDVVLGQPSLSSQQNINGTLSRQTIPRISGIASDGTKLFVSDDEGSRILAWNSIPTTNYALPDFVLGQPDFNSGNFSATASTLMLPNGLAICGTKLLAVDSWNYRVLIWNSIPNATQTPADVVIGQTNMTSRSQGLSSTKLNWPNDVKCNGSKLYIADTYNHRVLVYNSVPTTNGAAADLVLGQTNFTNNTSGTTASTMQFPKRLSIVNGKIIVSDNMNDRSIIWNSDPTSNGQAADLVLGQPNFTTNTTTYSASSLSDGTAVSYGQTFLHSDTGRDRILGWNSFPTSNNQAADFVLGHLDFTSNNMPNSPDPSSLLGYSHHLFTDGTRLFVSDSSHNRVLIWNSLATARTQWADIVLGQPNMNTTLENYGGLSASSLKYPVGVHFDGTKLYVADTGNHRVLIWNSLPTTNNQAASVVLGQTNFTTATTGTTASTMNGVTNVVLNGGKLYAADSSNHRVLVWNSIPTSNGQAANFAIGQPNLTTGTGACDASTLNYPTSIQFDNSKLIVNDSQYRVLVWNTVPTASGTAANIAIGQPDLTTCNAPSAVNSSSFSASPITISNGKLYLSDSYSSRILVWNTIPTVSGNTAADQVFGQPNFTSSEINYGGLSGTSLASPGHIFAYGGRLYISDGGNYRILSVPAP